MAKQRWTCMAAALTILSLTAGLWAAPEKELLITSFEDGLGPIKGDGKISQEQASDGKSSYKIEHKGEGYTGIWLEDKATLAKFKDFLLFKVDVYNPTDEPIQLGVRADDGKSKDFGSRFNDERGCTAAPGWSTYELNLTSLTKSNSKNFTAKEMLDIKDLRLIKIFVGGNKPQVLYFDNLRLEPSTLPNVAGLKAIDFGSSKSPVYPGFEGCNEKTVFGKDAEFGWRKPGAADNVYMPDALGGDYGTGDEFQMKLPDGKYIVHLCCDPFGIWASFPRFTSRQIILNGKTVLDQKMTPAEFFDKCYFLHEDEEDLPGQDLWAKFVLPRNVPRTFETEVKGGTLSLKIESDMKYGKYLQYLIVYPESSKDQGQAWVKSLEESRRTKFNKSMIVRLPPKEEAKVEPTAENKACGFVPFVRSPEVFCYVNAVPGKDEVGKPVAFAAAQGQREHAVLGLYPLAEVKDVTVTISDLTGPGGAKVPAAAVEVRKIRNFLKRQGRTRVGSLLPWLLQNFKSVDIAPGITRGLWLTLTVPADAAAGEYAGTLKVGSGDKSASVPIKVTVYPFALDKITDISMSATGARPPVPLYWPEMKDAYWKGAEQTIKDMALHGMNAVCGGPGAKLNGIKDGKADIDYSDMDKWLELANKYGLTMPGDSYQGCDVEGIPNDTKNVDKMFATCQEKFGVSYEELIKIVYTDVERHAKEKNWPKRSYAFLDEPRPEFGNIESAQKLIEIRTKAAPNTRFSGYYSTGQGRDDYFKLMPVSISHLNEAALAKVKEGGKEIWVYDGSRNRPNSGRWAFVAAQAGMKGYLTNGYMYVDSDPYFDFSDDEAAWCVAWPSRKGVTASVAYERYSAGIDDYRYLTTLQGLINKALKLSNAQAHTAVLAAQEFLKTSLAKVDVHNYASAALAPAEYDLFRATVAQQIIALKQVLGEIK